MAQARGYKGLLVLDFETAFGSDPAVKAGKLMPFNSFSVRGEKPKKDPATISGTRNPVEPYDGNLAVSGSVVAPMDLTAMGWWLRGMFGAPETSGEGPYTHVFKVGDSQPSMVLEHQMPDIPIYAKKNGCKVNKFSLNVTGGDDELVASMEMEGANETLDYARTIAAAVFAGAGLNDAAAGGAYAGNGEREYTVEIDLAAATDTFKWSVDGGATWEAEDVAITGAAQALDNGVTVTFGAVTGHTLGDKWTITATGGVMPYEAADDLTAVGFNRILNQHAAIQEGGVALAIAREFGMDIMFNLETDDYRIGGGGTRGGMLEGLISITGNLKALFTSQALLNKAINSTESSLQVAFTKGTHSLTLLLPEVQFSRNTPPIDGPKGIMQELPYTAYYKDAAQASAVVVTLVNDTASYA